MRGPRMKFHPLTGAPIVPLGILPNGRVIWPIMGAAEDPPPADPPGDPGKTDPPPTDPPKDPPADPDDKGAGGKQAILDDLAKERDKRQGLEQQLQEMQNQQQTQLDAIAVALGLKKDDAPADPAKLTEQVQQEQARAREAQVQLAVYRTAATAGGNADALLDSASFLRAIATIDPTDATAVQAAIKAAVEKNPLLAAEPAPNRPPLGGGPRSTEKPQAGSLGEAIAAKIAGASATH